MFPSLLRKLLLLLLLPPSLSKTSSKHFDTASSWSYIDRFVFLPTPSLSESTYPTGSTEKETYIKKNYGAFTYSIDFDASTYPTLMLYYNGFESWKKVYGSYLSCSEREEAAATTVDLWHSSLINTETLLPNEHWGSRTIKRATGYVYFTSPSPQWFFVAIGNCRPQSSGTINGDRCEKSGYCSGPLLVKVNYNFTNGSVESFKHFSYDRIGVYGIYLTFLIFQSILVGNLRGLRMALLSVNKYHATVQMLGVSVVLVWMSYLLYFIYYYRYMKYGNEDDVGLLYVAQFLYNVGDYTLVYLLIFLGKGWTMVRYKISGGGRIKIAVLVTVTLTTQMLVDGWSISGYDEADIVYYYQSSPGIICLCLRGFTALWFVYSCATTMRSFESKRRFYTRFMVLFFLWIAMKPTIAIFCNLFLDDSERYKYLVGYEVAAMFGAQLAMMLLYIPKMNFNRGFPFHSVSSVMLGMVQGQSASEYLREMAQREGRLSDTFGGVAGPSTPTNDQQMNVTKRPGINDVSPSGERSRAGANNNNNNNPESSLGTPSSTRDGGRQPHYSPPPLSLRHAKDVMKSAGVDMHRSLVSLVDASDELLSRLRDLDDYDGGDIDYGREQFSNRPDTRRTALTDLDEFRG
ncbi:hypothetical protein TrLO_g3215 [Triparma laevis f. longispina]|uniref:Intimal thickness related receptor IRP domain-containing protein n=1 Tax=Triparma laevis f. longispina TaxID=1714387 RepID=A0A9W7ARV3_9STRA|nr:hypothetical protein TrLO_g3215 [Triparma laevis f. longispina]